jgi:hypothetical protein
MPFTILMALPNFMLDSSDPLSTKLFCAHTKTDSTGNICSKSEWERLNNAVRKVPRCGGCRETKQCYVESCSEGGVV